MRERGNLNEIIVSPGRQLDGHYTFMTEHVCPVGALTTQDFRFKARVWFLRTAHERLPGLRDGVQRAPRLRPALQQGLPLPAARQREGQQVLDVRRGDAHVQARRTTGACSRRRSAARRRRPPSALEEVKTLFEGVAQGGHRRSCSRAQHSLEDNWALRELARVLIETPTRLRRAASPTGTRTTILIHQRQEPEHARASQQLAPGAQAVRRRSLDDVAAGARHARHRARRRDARSSARRRSRPAQGRDDRRARRAARREAGGRAPAVDVVGRAVGHVRERQGHAAGAREGARAARASASPAWQPGRRASPRRSATRRTWTKLKQIRAQLIGRRRGRGAGPRGRRRAVDAASAESVR